MKKYIFFFLFSIVPFSCTKKEKYPDAIIIPLGRSLNETANTILNDIKTYRIIPIETSDSVLLANFDIWGIYNGDLIVTDNGIVYFFDELTGKLKNKFSRKGNGPHEYLTISELKTDSMSGKIYILDYNKRNINSYSFSGEGIQSIKNDSIASFAINGSGHFIASFSPSEKWKNQVGIYDSGWTPIISYLKNKPIENGSSLFLVNSISTFNGENYIYVSDTLFNITEKEIYPKIIFDKGSLSIPSDILYNAKRSNEREQYIWGEYGFWAGDYYFLYYNHDNKGFYDLWKVSDRKLISRNIHITFEEQPGIPVNINGKTVYIWPAYTNNHKIYSIIDFNTAQELYPGYDENDNPLVLEITI